LRDLFSCNRSTSTPRSEGYSNQHFGQQQSYGLIAQEVEQVLPELVKEDEQGYKAVNYSKLPLLTLQAVKELKAENDAMKQQNQSLQQRNAALDVRLAAVEQALQQLLGQ
jgi:hypothetical protein